MGTDIHFFVERKTESGWETIPQPDPPAGTDPDRYGPHNWFWRKRGDIKYDWERDWDFPRNYAVFAILTGTVRAYAVDPDADYEAPPSFPSLTPEPRGRPEDFSLSGALGDGHSESWLMLSELLAFDWAEYTERRGAALRAAVQPFVDFMRVCLVPLGEPDRIRVVFDFDC